MSNRLFVSCVSDEFQKDTAWFPGFREQIRGYLTAADCEVKTQEGFRQTPTEIYWPQRFYARSLAALVGQGLARLALRRVGYFRQLRGAGFIVAPVQRQH